MNYFEFYNIPVSFLPDQKLVKSRFYELSKQHHPDFYVNESDAKQKEILELSTLNNKAFQVLSHKNKTLAYVLELEGELLEGEKYDLPADFLMEMMEVNEALMEMEFDFDADKLIEIKHQVQQIEADLDKENEENIEKYESVNQLDKKELLKKIKDIYYRKKYLLRIRESLLIFASR